jgi:hypothetical protein
MLSDLVRWRAIQMIGPKRPAHEPRLATDRSDVFLQVSVMLKQTLPIAACHRDRCNRVMFRRAGRAFDSGRRAARSSSKGITPKIAGSRQ